MCVTEDELIARLEQGLGDMALGDIKRAWRPGDSEPGGAKMGGFLLGFRFIDAAARSHSGRTKEMQGVIGKYFKAFVAKYMPRYNAVAPYHDLRSGLVHSYSVGQTYSLCLPVRRSAGVSPRCVATMGQWGPTTCPHGNSALT